ncbi:MAG TPA: tripartite tricarboxylate transporter substrate binding protein [Burkholderiales bacterium]|nr:tripartite tricarboxylate transporter substrate binding protein [Burkholderiales bacterium]
MKQQWVHWPTVLTALMANGTATAADAVKDFPTKPVRIIVGYTPGGGVDMAARLVGLALGELWNSSVVIDNRPGAAGGIGTEMTARAAPDGYTMMLCNIATHGITPARVAKLPYDPVRDFSFLSRVGGNPNVLMAHASLPARNIPELITYAKANPGKLSYGSSGVGASPHLSVELLKMMAGISIVHVPYKGAAPALADVMGGQIPLSVGNLPGGPLAAIKSGKVRGLAVTTLKRSTKAPDVPTMAESGVPGYEVNGWYGICSPKLPRALEAKINADLIKVLASDGLKKRLDDQGIDVQSSTPEELVAHVRAEIAKWVKVVKEAGLQSTE